MTEKRPAVSVVIVNWNGREFLKGCLGGVYRQSYRDFEVIFVDNGSTDGSVEYVRKGFPKARIIANKENLGIAAATNIGYSAARGKYIASLHNDTVPDRDWLKELVSAMEKAYKRVACIEGDVAHPGDVGVINASLNVLVYNIRDVFGDPRKKFYAGTCSMIMKNRLLHRHCDPEYFFYGEDVYMGWLLRLKGHHIVREPKSKVLHFGTKSVRDWKTKKLFGYLSERNRLSNFFLFYETGNMAKLAPLYLMVDAAKILGLAARSPWKAWAKVKAYLWFAKSMKKLWKKRALIQMQRAVPDRDITCMMSSRILPGGAPLSSELNRFSRKYCSLMGIRTVESS